MKKIIYILSAALLALAAASCKPEPVLSVSPNPVEVTSASGNSKLTITANYPWAASCNASWVHLKATSGTEEDTSLSFTVDENTTPDERTATITVTSETLSQSITVKQAQCDKLILSSKEETIDSAGGTITVKLSTNVTYSVSISSGTTWLKQSGTKGLQDFTETFIVEENTTYDERRCVITFSSGSLRESVAVIQKQKDALILESESDYSFDSTGGTFVVELKSNIGCVASVAEGAAWITQINTKGLQPYEFQFKVGKNGSNDARGGKIVFKDDAGNVAESVTVFQKGVPHVILDQAAILMEKEGGDAVVNVEANVTYQIQIPEEAAEWLTATQNEDGTQITFHLAENTDASSRYAKVTVKGDEGAASATLTVTQRGSDQMLVFVHSNKTLTIPAISGTDVSGSINWGDQKIDEYTTGKKHTYSKAGTYSVSVTVVHAETVEFPELIGIASIDLSGL